jgi:integrase
LKGRRLLSERRRSVLRLSTKGGKQHDVPCRHRLDRCLHDYIEAAGIETRIGNHTFRATGITAYLKNSGKLDVAQQIANHASPRTIKLYDGRNDEISLDEIERITI